jgi:hypothetical protein
MSSFVKKINTTPQLYKARNGVKSTCNGQYVVSTGNASLDEVMGGGLLLGSLAIQFEDSISQYCGHFLKNFLGEAIVRDQKIVIVDPATTHRSREWWLKFLPQVSVHQVQ